MDNNIEKYQSKELVTREAQIANALETHPKDWQKDIQPGNYIIDMSWHDPTSNDALAYKQILSKLQKFC